MPRGSAAASRLRATTSSLQSGHAPFQARPRFVPDARAPAVRPATVSRWRLRAFYGVVGVGTLGVLYCTYTYQTFKREAEQYRGNPPPLDTSDRFNSCADTFDNSVDFSEYWTGISNLRRALLSKAQGHVLEVSVGTGRNATFYPLTRRVKSVTMVDKSGEMIRVARMQWAKHNAWFINAAFRIQSATDPIPVPLVRSDQDPLATLVRQDGFDTVVQTMGICSTGDPVAVLKNLGRLCTPEGTILLLEHGRGRYRWLNRIIDEIAPAHADRWGCWFNKDIGAIVRESGLEIVEEKRYHMGTTWWYVLKPPQDRGILEPSPKSVELNQDHEEAMPEKPGSWLWWW